MIAILLIERAIERIAIERIAMERIAIERIASKTLYKAYLRLSCVF